MKKTTIYQSLFFACCAIIFSSCTVTQKSRTYDYDYVFITKQGIIQKPLIADMEVGKQKLTVSRTYKNTTVAMAKQNVIEEFIRSNNADLIVQPFFTTDAESNTVKTTVVITLTGYPANYKNIRNYEPKDKEYLLPREYFLGTDNTPVRTSSEGTLAPKKKTAAGKILGATLLVAAIAAAASGAL